MERQTQLTGKQPSKSAHKYVYSFEEGDGKNKGLLGGKGANLCEMTQIGLNVPPGFVITTEACLSYLAAPDKKLPAGLMNEVRDHMSELERTTGKGFGAKADPLLVSVRSGAAMSMPGMMDTVLNLGLNRETLDGLAAQTGNQRFAFDAYRRFIQLFGKIALDVPDEQFDEQFEAIKKRVGAEADVDLSATHLKEICDSFLGVVKRKTGKSFPDDPYVQLEIAVKAVFDSWMGKRAIDYRREFNITEDMANGTAVNIVAMVFGNMGNDSGTGVAFTRNPGTGENAFYGEYLVNAQGEDVVAGIRTPKPVQDMLKEMPDMYQQLEDLRKKLESHYREVQDFEFTIERGILYCLQTRTGKMNAAAKVRTSIEMEREDLIDREKALLRVDPELLEQLLYPRIDPGYEREPAAQGIAASPGASWGKIVFDADRAEAEGRLGEKVILVREETKPEDIHGFFAAQGILTSRGGKTSHAAVVARGMGKPCVAGAEGINVDARARSARVGDHVLREGDTITIDGTTGDVYLGEAPMVEPEFSAELETLLNWADEIARLEVMTNADTPDDAERALKYGAMGIGLCRTERMFNASDRLPIVVEMILAETPEEREAALNRLLPIQRKDFKELFKVMSPRPVTVRLLDPPIHEFLPTEQTLVDEIAHLHNLRGTVADMVGLSDTLKLLDPEHPDESVESLEKLRKVLKKLQKGRVDEKLIAAKENILRKARALREINPMLGHRGVRLAITYPEIYRMQIQGILEAAAECMKEGIDVHPEIMVPQVCTAKELEFVANFVDEVRQETERAYEVKIPFHFGTMIEVVRACMRADKLAEVARFFSFGTNDLSQATFSFSREDAENKFLPLYNKIGILRDNPFEVLDVQGMGRLMALTVEWGRKTRPDLVVGICGEHGGHPDSIRFCHHIGLHYVSCSAPRVPIARLAAARAKLLENEYQFD
ncbi:MAG: pyruvate, phosphate dikinase [Acidiferrobacterales bacterium]